MSILVRSERPPDYAAIEHVNLQAFGQAAEARLVATCRERGGFDPALSLVAVRNDLVVGHILFSPIHIETEAEHTAALALAPMAVLPEYQRQGIGSDLVRTGLVACRDRGHRIVIVLGHAEYYTRFGFQPASRFGLHAPFSVADEVFMAMELTPGALVGVHGTVIYPPAFDSV